MYVIVAVSDKDGGYGDAIETTYPIAVFTTESEAEAYVAKYSNDYVYDRPYDALHEGELRVVPVTLSPDKEVKAYESI